MLTTVSMGMSATRPGVRPETEGALRVPRLPERTPICVQTPWRSSAEGSRRVDKSA